MISEIELNIEQLVLEGFSRQETYNLRDFLAEELWALFNANQDVKFENDQNIVNLKGSSFQVEESINAKHLAKKIAVNIYQNLIRS